MDLRLREPRVTTHGTLLVAGSAERFTPTSVQRIALLWQRFAPSIGNVPGQVGYVSYGVCFNNDDESFEYLCGVEVASLEALPDELRGLRIPARSYAVFTHSGHISAIRNTMDAIWKRWLPSSSLAVADAPYFERYDANFDAHTGNGKVEVWIPLDTEK